MSEMDRTPIRATLTAFRRTGKDTLCQALRSGELPSLGWQVYSRSGDRFPTFESPTRIALADKLKYLVCDSLGLPRSLVDSGEFEIQKDLPRSPETLREVCIRLALEYKAQYGETYFVDLVQSEISEIPGDILITDNRYPFEVLPGWLCIKLFRKEIPIPTDQSETSMNNYPFDYVLVKDSEDFDLLCQVSPQCRDYIPLGPIS